jgi:hypothetical protein
MAGRLATAGPMLQKPKSLQQVIISHFLSLIFFVKLL